VKKALLLITCIFFTPIPSYAQPAIQFDHPEHDFSVISQEETVEHTFEFANRGDRELVIEKVTPS